jgi:dephospho-CoA kinase
MKRILLTGMSGTGKSSVIRALADLGYKAIDTDDGWCEQLPDGRQRWREDAITALLATEDADALFLAGWEENQVRFHPQFDHIILLSAPIKTMLQRLGARTSNPYGKAPGDLDRVISDTQKIETMTEPCFAVGDEEALSAAFPEAMCGDHLHPCRAVP